MNPVPPHWYHFATVPVDPPVVEFPDPDPDVGTAIGAAEAWEAIVERVVADLDLQLSFVLFDAGAVVAAGAEAGREATSVVEVIGASLEASVGVVTGSGSEVATGAELDTGASEVETTADAVELATALTAPEVEAVELAEPPRTLSTAV